MRITQKTMFNDFVGGMNSSLSAYMASNEQGSTQKKINRPSDDPVGMARVLTQRAAIERGKQYEKASQDAKMWLDSTDSALTQAQTILSTIRERAEQASTATITKENRLQIAGQIRQLFGQLINLTNTSYTGQYLFAGHENNKPAYQQGLGVTTTDANLLNAARNDGTSAQVPWEVSGAADRTVIVRFDSVNGAPPGPGQTGVIGTDVIDYSFSKDGGETWVSRTVNAGDYELDLDGATIRMPQAGPNPSDLVAGVSVTTCDSADAMGRDNGTMLFVRPTAYYEGDTKDLPPLVDSYGSSLITSSNAYGSFSGDVRIRLDQSADVTLDGKLAYSYSLDNGITWQQATPADTHAGGTLVRLQVPGGYLDVEPQTGQMLNQGQQFVIRPRRSDMGYEISNGEFMSTINCGKDIFGGVYVRDGQTAAEPAEGGDRNIFEVVSDFIGYAESGVQDGCQEALAALQSSMDGLVTNITRVGGKVNRVSLNVTMLETTRDDITMRMSKAEDIDLTELLTRLTQQQMAYQTVLQSSSMIMQLNLTNFI